MIGSLRGTVLERSGDTSVLVEVGGVGYVVTVTPRTLAELEPSSPVFLYIHHHIREDAQTLFGFRQRDERSRDGDRIPHAEPALAAPRSSTCSRCSSKRRGPPQGRESGDEQQQE